MRGRPYERRRRSSYFWGSAASAPIFDSSQNMHYSYKTAKSTVHGSKLPAVFSTFPFPDILLHFRDQYAIQ